MSERGDSVEIAPEVARFDPRDAVPTLAWIGGPLDGRLRLIDQTRLPADCVLIDCTTVGQVWEAIRSLRVRGAPAIGIAAAYGCVLGARVRPTSPDAVREALHTAVERLRTARPTAVNLFWALERIGQAADRSHARTAEALLTELHTEATAIESEDRRTCRAIGAYGATLLRGLRGVLTHCNAGGLATADYGTALAVLFTAHEQGQALQVYADETRPLLQGARLTAWELQRRGIPVTVICDSMAAHVMRQGWVQAVIVGADRIAANGDTANKIGTYGLALLARAHSIPFYVAAPTSTFDPTIADGSQILIECRDPAEITHGSGRPTVPKGVSVYNPAFDVTPADLIDAIITERGIIQPVNYDQIARTLRESTRPQAHQA
ncbi:MAG: methylthioribose-1-phosphate isomerase [Isosphaeraceae bacterium]|jgi:methylthioribose-1-phosphate isomerase|nr:MAG: methylthioribose-1-phosphate isomerase [Isosphaeraceae bacterium]